GVVCAGATGALVGAALGVGAEQAASSAPVSTEPPRRTTNARRLIVIEPPVLLAEMLARAKMVGDGVAKLRGGDSLLAGAGDVGGAEAHLDDVVYCHFDGAGMSFEVERVAQQQRQTLDGGDGVGFVLAGDVGGGTVNGLEQAQVATVAIAGLAQARAWHQAH